MTANPIKTYPVTSSPLATNSSPGIVQPDDTTITINGSGVISSIGGGGLTLIQSQVLASTATSVTFSAIPQIYTNLRLVGTFNAVGGALFSLQFNGDTGSHYNSAIVYASGNTPTGASNSATSMHLAALQGSVDMSIPFYVSSPLGIGLLVTFQDGASASGAGGGNWSGTNVTSIKLFDSAGGTFAIGSSFALYGY